MSLTVRQLALRWGYEAPDSDTTTVAPSVNAGEQVIRRLIRDGVLPAFKVGRAYRVRLVDVEDYELKGAA